GPLLMDRFDPLRTLRLSAQVGGHGWMGAEMPRLLRWVSRFGLLGLYACSGVGPSDDHKGGEAVAAPGPFFAQPDGETLVLPTSVTELNAYIVRTGAISDHRGPGQTLSAPVALPRSICPQTIEAVVFSYPLQRGGFVPGYTAHITNGE